MADAVLIMKIQKLNIENFRGIRRAQLDDLPDNVIIAGPNGTGKSCLFDAIRLTKSLYGGYRKEREYENFARTKSKTQCGG
jgi:AAA15 family ATPase/GTPase